MRNNWGWPLNNEEKFDLLLKILVVVLILVGWWYWPRR
jgi:hypothetical protein